MKRSFRIGAGGLCGLFVFVAAALQPVGAAGHKTKKAEPPSASLKSGTKPKPVSTVKVTVANFRPASLIELRAGVSGSGAMRKVLGPLKPGKEAVARLPRGEDCEVDLHGSFDDGQTIDSTGFDICANKTLNLTD